MMYFEISVVYHNSEKESAAITKTKTNPELCYILADNMLSCKDLISLSPLLILNQITCGSQSGLRSHILVGMSDRENPSA